MFSQRDYKLAEWLVSPMGKVEEIECGNHGPQTVCFTIEMKCFLQDTSESHSIHMGNIVFPERDSGLAEMLVYPRAKLGIWHVGIAF